jgi:hypothetical protein
VPIDSRRINNGKLEISKIAKRKPNDFKTPELKIDAQYKIGLPNLELIPF